MRTSRATLLSLLFAFVLVAVGCTDVSALDEAYGGSIDPGVANNCQSGDINASGSSTVEPITTRVAELYEEVCLDTIVTVDGPGTGDGFKLFCAGETDISNASRAIKDTEAEDCAEQGIEFTELQVAFDGIAIMTSPANSAVDCLSFVDLYALLGGESAGFTNWADASELGASLGSTIEYPDAPLDISGPGTESGTYDSFIEIVLEHPAELSQGDDVPLGVIRTDFSGNADDNVIIEGIAGASSSIGWSGFAFADENQDSVKVLAISEEPGGECVLPTIETIADGSYPVSRSLYVYVNNGKLETNPALAGFVDYYLDDGYVDSVSRAFGRTGYVPLPDDVLAETRANLGGASS